MVRQNYAAVDATLVNLFEVRVPAGVTSTFDLPQSSPRMRPVRPRGDGEDDGGTGRRDSGKLTAGRRNFSVGYKRVREAERRRRRSSVGI